MIPWHHEFLFGDTEYTLDPVCHAIVEAEANYGAARLLFLQDRFAQEARDLQPGFKSIKSLAARYGNTITSALWRCVEDREPNQPVFGMVTIHPRHPEIGATESGQQVRYFIRSTGFRKQFPNVSPSSAFAVLARHASWNKNGPLVETDHTFADVNGEGWIFHIESFSNSHAVLTYGSAVARRSTYVPRQ